ncbi:MAG TPA: prepilin-type N-terminal cleavage/methylation domain-containing protein [Pyrinomonadaceae bacterium]|nr:prepilin-type N-terminal cleavage/methylation domain-containing protein [Pyrinomonadaceae bacterium]
MGRSSYTIRRQDGMTVVEVLVVVIIIAVIAAFAIMQKGSANEQFQRQNVAHELKVAFERARFDSVKRRAEGAGPAEVFIETDRFTLRTDSDLSTDGLESTVTALPPNISIAIFEGVTGDVTVAFDKRGETTTTGATTPAFLVCNGTCTANDDSPANSNIVLITATGTVNLLPGGATLQTFNAPTVAAPIGDAANIDLNSWAQLTPTPTP